MITIPPPPPSIFEIKGVVQRYAWGKRGEQSRVGLLSGEGISQPEFPFAEMWFGAHQSYPSPIIWGQETASNVPAKNLYEFLSTHQVRSPSKHSTTALPFLMKVLSVGAPLSIQLHPNKADAEKLHQAQPNHYPDSNHKPELALALSEVELLCGIRPIEEIQKIRSTLPVLAELTACLDLDLPDDQKAVELFRALFFLPNTSREKIVRSIVEGSEVQPLIHNHLKWVSIATSTNAFHDPGLIGMLLLNHIKLSPGDGVYISPGIPHAYLSGDLVECMASSDNVVRAGLTEKYIDVSTFVQLLRYDASFNPRLLELPYKNPAISIFSPPVPDFKLVRIKRSTAVLRDVVNAPAIIVCLEGSAILQDAPTSRSWHLTPGSAIFIGGPYEYLSIDGPEADIFIASGNC